MFVQFISYYAVADSSKYTFRIMVKGLCALGSGDSQSFAPLYDVCIAVSIANLYLILLHTKQIPASLLPKPPYQYNSTCYVHFTVPLYVIYRCVNNTSQSYAYETYVAFTIQYPLKIHKFTFNALGSFNISRLCICARSTDVVHIILKIRTICFINYFKFRLILQSVS